MKAMPFDNSPWISRRIPSRLHLVFSSRKFCNDSSQDFTWNSSRNSFRSASRYFQGSSFPRLFLWFFRIFSGITQGIRREISLSIMLSNVSRVSVKNSIKDSSQDSYRHFSRDFFLHPRGVFLDIPGIPAAILLGFPFFIEPNILQGFLMWFIVDTVRNSSRKSFQDSIWNSSRDSFIKLSRNYFGNSHGISLENNFSIL